MTMSLDSHPAGNTKLNTSNINTKNIIITLIMFCTLKNSLINPCYIYNNNKPRKINKNPEKLTTINTQKH